MKRSNFFMPMRHSVSASDSKSGEYFERLGMIARLGSGLFSHLPFFFSLKTNLKNILNKHLADAGCSFHEFPGIQPRDIWEHRIDVFGDNVFQLKDKHGKDLVLAPTHEIAAAVTAAQFIKSYRQLPIKISQIQNKFRDETRPRGGVIRSRQFEMHDAYSFDRDIDAAMIAYDSICDAYRKTLTEIRVPFTVKLQEDMGSIGGIKSHEYHVKAEAGEDTFVDSKTGNEFSSLEIGHTFMLADKYSGPVGATFELPDGTRKPVFMCSFGLGIERTVAAYVESHYKDGKDLTWSWALAPFKVMVLGAQNREAWEIYDSLNNAGIATIIDDRNDIQFGQQIKEGFLMGCPICVVLGRTFANEGIIELNAPNLQLKLTVKPSEVVVSILELRRHIEAIEIVSMSFEVIKVDNERRLVYAEIGSLEQLQDSFCQRLETGTDLLGNFDRRKRITGEMTLRSDVYRVIPIKKHEHKSVSRQTHNSIDVYLVPDTSPSTLPSLIAL